MAALNCVIFKINNALYAVDAGTVLGVENNVKLQTIPGQPVFLTGFAEIRGVLTPVLSVRSHFGLPEVQNEAAAILVIADEKGQFAYQTDGVETISILNFDDVNNAPLIIKSFAACVQRVTMLNGQPVVLMDLPSIISEEEKVVVEHFVKKLSEEE